MRSLTLYYPSGDDETVTDVAKVLQFMHCPYEHHWGPYSPVVVMTWHEDEDRESTFREGLTVVRHVTYGWWFLYHSGNTWLSPLAAGGETDKWVEQWYGGETKFFLRDSFVDADACDRIVTEFMTTAQPAPGFDWQAIDSYCDELEDFGGECVCQAEE